MNPLVRNFNSHLKWSLDNEEFSEKRVNQDIAMKNTFSVKELHIQDNKTISYDYKYYEEKDRRSKPYAVSKDPLHITISIFIAIMLALVVTLIVMEVRKVIEANVISNINNNSVAIFTPNEIHQVESYTLSNDVFVGFIKKTHSRSGCQ